MNKKAVVEEVVEKLRDYEGAMGSFIADFNAWSDLFTIKRPARQSKGYSNPRTTEMFRAVNALSTMEVRMMTAQDPYFDIAPMDIMADNSRLSKIQATIETQLRLTNHKRQLLKACQSKNLVGTVIVEEPWWVYPQSIFGRKMPATAFVPRSMLQVAFDRNCFQIDDAEWLSTADLYTPARMRSLLRDDPDQKEWIHREMESAINDSEMPEVMAGGFIEARLMAAGYPMEDDRKKVREFAMYHGKLDTMNDGIEYCVGLINRKYMVKFRAAENQTGRRNFRVAHFLEWELEPLGYGLGKLLAPLHKSIDANRRRVQDGAAFDTYGMWLKDRNANINVSDLKVALNKTIDTDMINGLKRLESGVAGLQVGLKLDELLKQEFRAASGATDTLQALITEATASEVTLAQNEAVRNISLKAELAAEGLVREHVEIMHANNMEHIDEPLLINVLGKPERVYPADLYADVDFRTKVTTDKDYKPERMKKLVEILTVLTSIRNEHPDRESISIMPIVMELARGLGINADALIRRPPAVQVLPTPGAPGQLPAGVGAPAGMPIDAVPGAAAGIPTPVGSVMGSPQ